MHTNEPRPDLPVVPEPETDEFAPNGIEPRINSDSHQRMRQEKRDPSHAGSRFDAGTGQGTVSGPPHDGPLQERPVLDGSTQSYAVESTVPNPNRGEDDPGRIAHQPALNTSNTNRWLFAAVIAATIMTGVLLLLLPWSPFWCGIGITVALVGVLAMLAIRASGVSLRRRLRIDAILMAVVWLVPLTIFIVVLLTSAEAIWNRVS